MERGTSAALESSAAIPDEILIQDMAMGATALPKFVGPILRSRVFQRLRNLAQTGCTRILFPGCTHTREAHCRGTAALASRALELISGAQPELAITGPEAANVVTAALLHDLGHGPLSHAWSRFQHRAVPTAPDHEAMSCALIDVMVAEDAAVAQSLADSGVCLDTVKAMIRGREPEAGHPRCFLYQLVSNRNGIDMDRLDYLRRDALSAGLPVHVDPPTLIETVRVVDGQLAWPAEVLPYLSHVFEHRYNLHAQVYQRSEVAALDMMVTQALYHQRAMTLPGTGVALQDVHAHPELYVSLTDWVVDCALAGMHVLGNGESTEADREAAKQLWARCAKVDLWPLAGQVHLDPALASAVLRVPDGVAVIKQRLAELAGLCEDAIAVDIANIHAGHGSMDPLDVVPLFGPQGTRVHRSTMPLDRWASVHQTFLLRVYVLQGRHLGAVSAATRTWATMTKGKVNATPVEF